MSDDLPSRIAYLFEKESWKLKGVCRRPGIDPDLFFPDRGESGVQARHYCETCPIALECLEYAIKHNIRDGIWGGAGPNERDEMKKSGERSVPPPIRRRKRRSNGGNDERTEASQG